MRIHDLAVQSDQCFGVIAGRPPHIQGIPKRFDQQDIAQEIVANMVIIFRGRERVAVVGLKRRFATLSAPLRMFVRKRFDGALQEMELNA